MDTWCASLIVRRRTVSGRVRQTAWRPNGRPGVHGPPYNVRIDGHVSGLGRVRHSEFVMACGEMAEPDFTAFLATTLSLAAKASRDGALHYVCMDWRHLAEILSAGRKA